MISRATALGAALVLATVLVGAVVATTPWHVVPHRPAQISTTEVSTAEGMRSFTAADKAREDAFHRRIRPPAYLALAAGLATALTLGLTPLGARLLAAAARPFGGGWVASVLVGAFAVVALGRLVALPFDARAEAVLRDVGLSTRTWQSWLVDVAKGFAVDAGLTLLALLALVAVARALPRWWWAVAAVGAGGLVLAVSFLWPVVVEPIFNRFTPLPQGPLRSELLALARADAVPVRDVLVADASRRTSSLNAYVSGFGATRRIVVYDTLVRGASPAEVRLVVAHELGHAKDRDVLRGSLLAAVGAAAGVCLIALLLSWPPLLARAGAGGAGDPRAVPLVLLVAALLSLATAPITMLVSRRVEARADVHSLDLTRDPATFVASERRLAVRNLADLDPPPLVYAMFATHPTPPQRIALAHEWARLHGVPVAPVPIAPAPIAPVPVPAQKAPQAPQTGAPR